MKKYLDKKAILDTRLRTREVSVPEWGGTILIRELSAGDTFVISQLRSVVDTESVMAAYVALSVIDDNGNKVFTQEQDDIKAILGLGYEPLTRLTDEILDLSNLKKKEPELKN